MGSHVDAQEGSSPFGGRYDGSSGSIWISVSDVNAPQPTLLVPLLHSCRLTWRLKDCRS